jgi:threonine/homoserine/homoserine lactone efflux protein
LGLSTIINKTEAVPNDKNKITPTITPLKAVSQGFFTNVLNPKASLFFLSLFTLVVAPNTAQSTLILISFFLIVNTVLWFSFVAVFMTQKHIRNLYYRYQNRMSKVFGGILIAIGIKIAFSD